MITFLILLRIALCALHALRAEEYVYKQRNWQELQEHLKFDKFLVSFLDLRKWTYKQFYPEFK